MSQDYQSIGQEASQLAAVAEQRQGRQGTPAESDGEEFTDSTDFSFYDRRSNRQALGREIDNMASYSEPPMAAVIVSPPGESH